MRTTMSKQFKAILLFLASAHVSFAQIRSSVLATSSNFEQAVVISKASNRVMCLPQMPPLPVALAAIQEKPNEEASKKKRKWPWLLVGGAAVGVGAVILLISSGDEEKPSSIRGLPRPPNVP